MLEMHVHELVERISGAVAGPSPASRACARASSSSGSSRSAAGRGGSCSGTPTIPTPSRLDRLRDEVAAAIVQLMSEEAGQGLDFPKMPQMVEMIAQQLVGAMQSLADWSGPPPSASLDGHDVQQVAMDFA